MAHIKFADTQLNEGSVLRLLHGLNQLLGLNHECDFVGL